MAFKVIRSSKTYLPHRIRPISWWLENFLVLRKIEKVEYKNLVKRLLHLQVKMSFLPYRGPRGSIWLIFTRGALHRVWTSVLGWTTFGRNGWREVFHWICTEFSITNGFTIMCAIAGPSFSLWFVSTWTKYCTLMWFNTKNGSNFKYHIGYISSFLASVQGVECLWS